MVKLIKADDLFRDPSKALESVRFDVGIVVTWEGLPVARLLPVSNDDAWVANRDQAQEAMRQAVNPELAQLIEENRRAELGPDL